ncbi:hypothetical protein BY996DRAFT_6432683 [Phakopsora pachyrhizi]|uniref:CSD domain-containing protein n=1 Tax=Phakopsora pachyrhizi TaxID=170000 RepID=A0AAV0AMF8_PHAPC|nr:hypothetical protein BY996DRAFT_6435794 [Phakopsora pachyrhizi]KAI8449824.1 hypothetical protein BY996DRAFT_6432683 [Phakopsora pachyrhizi]CAH7669245.1 hypothetical protein PPACK8108_LOCUS3832 [Phakopsora pachyrhizi]
MSYEKTYLTVHSPSFGSLSPAYSTTPSALSCSMNPQMMPIIGYPGQPMFMTAYPPPPGHMPMPQSSVIDKSNPPPRRTGVCKFFNIGKGFGFIKDSRPDELPLMKGDPGTDIFVHYSCIVSCDAPYKSLLDGEPVEYYLGRSNKGLAALEITGPGGANVKGSTNSRSPTVLHPMSFMEPISDSGGPLLQITSAASQVDSPRVSPGIEKNGFQTSPVLSVSMAGSSSPHSQSPTFPLAVGVPLNWTQHLRRETTECLGVPAINSAAKMFRIASTPISAPGFGSALRKESRDSPSLGVGIGIGVHWEPKSRGQSPQWSPPGGRRVSIKDLQVTSFVPSSSVRKAGGNSVDRTKSNWRVEDIKSTATSPVIPSQANSPIISI